MSGDGISGTGADGGVRFLGARRDYWWLLGRGGVLLMFTLGIYRFWLTTDVRRFLWSNTEVAGECLDYSGTAAELLIGFMMAIAILIPLYTGFFVAALDLGPIGKLSSVIAFATVFVLGQYAIYRARSYRLTRSVFRGLRFHQDGSAWVYALRAILWWIATGLTLGLAYPFQLASLERYKMRHTFYGDLPGRFAGSGFRLFLRGAPMWLALFVPLAIAAAVLIANIDPATIGQALAESTNTATGRGAEGSSNDALGVAAVIAVLLVLLMLIIGVALYPVFQGVVMRWWLDGLRFGEVELTSKLRIRDVYRAYLLFLGHALVFSLVVSMAGSAAFAVLTAIFGSNFKTGYAGIAAAGVGLVGYVISMLGYSTIYRGTVLFSLWQLAVESLHLSGTAVLERVNARGRPASALGEGLADALHVDGY